MPEKLFGSIGVPMVVTRSNEPQLVAIATAPAEILDEVPALRDVSGGPESIRAYSERG